MNLIVSAIGQGFLWGLLGLGLYLSFRIMNTTDMTVEGTFPLGASVAVSLIVKGQPMAGDFGGLYRRKLGWPGHGLADHKGRSQPAGRVLTMTGIYSVDLMVMGKSNVSLLGKSTILPMLSLKSLPHTLTRSLPEL